MSPLHSIEAKIEEMSLLKHPFYQLWNKGELTVEDLKTYAKEYYELVRHVPLIVTSVMQNAPEERKFDIIKHIADEEDHVDLWLRFAEALGLDEEEVEEYEPSEKTKEAVQSLVTLAKRTFIGGVAAMYALEKELPKIAQTKLEGLMRFYGFDKLTTGGMGSSDARAYFEEHLKEEKHSSYWRDLLSELTGADADRAEQAATASLLAQNRILDGVCEEAGICTECEDPTDSR